MRPNFALGSWGAPCFSPGRFDEEGSAASPCHCAVVGYAVMKGWEGGGERG